MGNARRAFSAHILSFIVLFMWLPCLLFAIVRCIDLITDSTDRVHGWTNKHICMYRVSLGPTGR
jgi:hypothetical protein